MGHYHNSLNESVLHNDVVVMPVDITILPPNLAPLALQIPAAITGTPNPSVQFVWGVTNEGVGTASGYWYDKIYFSLNPFSADSLLFSSTETGPVPSGGSYWRTNFIQMPVT